MKASKVTAILVLFFIVLLTNTTAQEKKDGNFLHKIYISAGYEFASLKNSDEFSNLTGNGGIMLSLAYNYKPQIQFEMRYVYANDILFNYIEEHYYTPYSAYSHELFDRIWSNNFSLKVNYYFAKKTEDNPLFVTAGITAAIQRVKLYELYGYDVHDSSGHDSFYSSFNNLESHTRVIIGPEAGIGLFLAFGKINFKSEFTFAARFSPFKDTAYKELAFNFTNGLVYKF